jgi:hypothetical protein
VDGRGFSDVRDVAEPGGTLMEQLVGLCKGGQRCLETLIQLGQAWVIALGQQVETATSHVLEPLVGRYARQTTGRPAFEREQRVGVAKEL